MLVCLCFKNDEQRDVQQVLAENVNKRLTNAMEELKEKHAKGTNEIDDPDRAPTGAPYRIIEQQKAAQLAAQQRQAAQQLQQQQEEQQQLRIQQQVIDQENNNNNGNDSDDDLDAWLDDFDNDDDDDPILEQIRQKRMTELKAAQQKHAEHIALGHGQYRTITQDEFLPECTGASEFVTIHFFHKQFERCSIMDEHLKIVAQRHTTCKFLRIDAEKTPFFVTKLAIRTLPTVIVFQHGKAIKRLTGFEGLMNSTAPGNNGKEEELVDKFPTSRLQQWLAETGAIEYDIVKDEIAREEILSRQGRNNHHHHGAIWGTSREYGDDF